MPNYRRIWTAGGTYFFTVALADRTSTLLVDRIGDLRDAVRVTRASRPFEIVAMVVMPEHLHAVWTLPPGDADCATRWAQLKAHFTRVVHAGEIARPSLERRRERGVWQRRFWARQLTEADLATHVDYIHFNPVKHGHVLRVADWPWSTFHRFVREGRLPGDWASEPPKRICNE